MAKSTPFHVDAARRLLALEPAAGGGDAARAAAAERAYDEVSARLSPVIGAQLSFDGTLIVDDNGLAKGNAPHEASGPVHLVAATHAITVDYFQATGNVALQLFCTKSGGP
jgi:hypothetical protein